MRDVPQKLRGRDDNEMLPMAFAAWALAESRSDVVVACPLKTHERVLLYLVPLLNHLRSSTWVGSGRLPSALVVGRSKVLSGLRRVLCRAAGVYVPSTQPDPGAVLPGMCEHGDVLLGSASDVAAWAAREAGQGPDHLSQISFVVLDDLDHLLQEEGPAVRMLLERLQKRGGWQSLLWSTEWRQLQNPMVDAFTTKPVVLRAADSVWQATQVVEVMEEGEVSSRVLFYLQRYASLRVLVFADRPEALKKSLPSWFLSDPSSTAESGRGRVQVVPNHVAWDSGGLFDVVLHANAPPDRGEFHRRLGSCRQLAVALLATVSRGGGRRLTDAWLSFAEYARTSVVGEDAELLRKLALESDEVEARVSDLTQLTEEIAQREAKTDPDWDAFRDGVGADMAWDDWGGGHVSF